MSQCPSPILKSFTPAKPEAGLAGRKGVGEDQGDHAEKGHGPDGQRVDHESHDGGRHDGHKLPGLRGDAIWCGNDPHEETDCQNDEELLRPVHGGTSIC